MLVYRLEHAETGLGPFWHDDLDVRKMVSIQAAREGLPGPCLDGIPDDAGELLFGCPSLAVLRDTWFPGLYDLILGDFVVAVYDVPEHFIHAGQSGLQVAFDPGVANCVTRLGVAA